MTTCTEVLTLPYSQGHKRHDIELKNSFKLLIQNIVCLSGTKHHTFIVCPIVVKACSSNNFSSNWNTLLSLIWFNLCRHSSALWESGKNAAIFVNMLSIFFCISSRQISWKKLPSSIVIKLANHRWNT